MRSLKPLLRANAAALALTAFGGCAVGPDFVPPKPPQTTGYTRNPLRLFDGFTLLHRERPARAALEVASERYRSTVVTAFQNVSDTLKALEIDARGLQAAAVSEHAASRSFAISQKLLDPGAIGFLTFEPLG
jgi:outer membrane protein TolC